MVVGAPNVDIKKKKNMKIKIQGFLGSNHSWSFVNQNIATSLIKKGHDVHLKSTNGYLYFPEDLKKNIRENLDKEYDLQFSYTALHMFAYNLINGQKNRFGTWVYEWKIIPPSMIKYHNFCDKLLAPSQFAKDCFVNSKIPENKVIVIPHGINIKDFDNKNKFLLKTKKKRIIFVNIGQPHLRKAIPDMFKAYLEAFTNNDDVCLVAKISRRDKLEQSFEVDPIAIYNRIKKEYKNPAEVELITNYIPNIVELYNACDIVYTLSHCEGFYMPGVEALAANKLNIAPRYGGQLDFLNDNNSLLVGGKIVQAPVKSQYWQASIHNTHFQSDIGDAIEKLRTAVFRYDELMEKFLPQINSTVEEYTWDKVVEKILNLVE